MAEKGGDKINQVQEIFIKNLLMRCKAEQNGAFSKLYILNFFSGLQEIPLQILCTQSIFCRDDNDESKFLMDI